MGREPRAARRRDLCRAIALISALAAAAGIATAAAEATAPPAQKTAATACGARTQATIAAADSAVAAHIYGNELAGREVNTDIVNVTSSTSLRKAVAADDAAATKAAVLAIIFHPAWHIVRLQVYDRRGKLLSDIGGTWTIAPVAGLLKSGSHTIGRFLMSVQDDTGETKLETRFVGNPIAIYVDGIVVAERFGNFPAALPKSSSLELGSVRYSLVDQTFNAFPTGTLVEVMAVPPPARSLTRLACPAVRAGEFGRVAERLASLATNLPNQYPGYASTVAIYTGIDVFVRSGRRMLGTSGGPGPARPPSSGTVNYAGASWLVYSFMPESGVTVYLLIPPS